MEASGHPIRAILEPGSTGFCPPSTVPDRFASSISLGETGSLSYNLSRLYLEATHAQHKPVWHQFHHPRTTARPRALLRRAVGNLPLFHREPPGEVSTFPPHVTPV